MPELLPLRHGAWSAPRSRSTAGRPSRWLPTWRPRRRPGSTSSAAEMRTSPTSADSPRPERRIIFSINDLDETLPAPWEWDVKRLAASFVAACRDNGLKDAAARTVVTTCVRDLPRGHGAAQQAAGRSTSGTRRSTRATFCEPSRTRSCTGGSSSASRRSAAKSRAEEIFPKLVEHKGTMPLIRDQLPTIFHHEGHPPGDIQRPYGTWRPAIAPRFRPRTSPCSTATSSGTPPSRSWGLGASGRPAGCCSSRPGEGDPLFLQVKEARSSVLEPYAGKSAFPNHGQRVVDGYRRMQPASDMFLGGPGAGAATSSCGNSGTSRSAPAWRPSTRPMELYGTRCGQRPRAVPCPLRPLLGAERRHGQERRLRRGHRGASRWPMPTRTRRTTRPSARDPQRDREGDVRGGGIRPPGEGKTSRDGSDPAGSGAVPPGPIDRRWPSEGRVLGERRGSSAIIWAGLGGARPVLRRERVAKKPVQALLQGLRSHRACNTGLFE